MRWYRGGSSSLISRASCASAHTERHWIQHLQQKPQHVAIKQANAHDCVLIAGKGHEKFQIMGDDKIPFDDKAVALEILDET